METIFSVRGERMSEKKKKKKYRERLWPAPCLVCQSLERSKTVINTVGSFCLFTPSSSSILLRSLLPDCGRQPGGERRSLAPHGIHVRCSAPIEIGGSCGNVTTGLFPEWRLENRASVSSNVSSLRPKCAVICAFLTLVFPNEQPAPLFGSRNPSFMRG